MAVPVSVSSSPWETQVKQYSRRTSALLFAQYTVTLNHTLIDEWSPRSNPRVISPVSYRPLAALCPACSPHIFWLVNTPQTEKVQNFQLERPGRSRRKCIIAHAASPHTCVNMPFHATLFVQIAIFALNYVYGNKTNVYVLILFFLLNIAKIKKDCKFSVNLSFHKLLFNLIFLFNKLFYHENG